MQIIIEFRSLNYAPVLTDGSKKHNTSFALTKEEGNIIAGGIIPAYTSLYNAESFAIPKAMQQAITSKGKFVISTDSISCLLAIDNTVTILRNQPR